MAEEKNKCDEAKIKLDIEFTKYPKHATKLAESAKDKMRFNYCGRWGWNNK